jgi:hypothetical protein
MTKPQQGTQHQSTKISANKFPTRDKKISKLGPSLFGMFHSYQKAGISGRRNTLFKIKVFGRRASEKPVGAQIRYPQGSSRK